MLLSNRPIVIAKIIFGIDYIGTSSLTCVYYLTNLPRTCYYPINLSLLLNKLIGTFYYRKNNIWDEFSNLSLLPEKIIAVAKIILGTSSLTYRDYKNNIGDEFFNLPRLQKQY
jgi:hypothetical protein